MGARYLYLVRHGQYQMDRGHEAYGSLTALGRRQAHCVSRRLSALPISALYHSDILRAVQTAQIINRQFSGLVAVASKLLREGIPTAPKHWGKDRPTKRELFADRKRMDAAYEKFFKSTRGPDRHELFVGHGNCIRYLVRRALEDHVHKWWRLEPMQCSLTVVCVRSKPRPTTLVSFNDVGHLPQRMQTFL